MCRGWGTDGGGVERKLEGGGRGKSRTGARRAVGWGGVEWSLEPEGELSSGGQLKPGERRAELSRPSALSHNSDHPKCPLQLPQYACPRESTSAPRVSEALCILACEYQGTAHCSFSGAEEHLIEPMLCHSILYRLSY